MEIIPFTVFFYTFEKIFIFKIRNTTLTETNKMKNLLVISGTKKLVLFFIFPSIFKSMTHFALIFVQGLKLRVKFYSFIHFCL